MFSSAVPSTLINSGSVSRSLFGWSAMSVGTQRSPPSPFLTPYLRTYNHYSTSPTSCQVSIAYESEGSPHSIRAVTTQRDYPPLSPLLSQPGHRLASSEHRRLGSPHLALC